MPEKYGKDRARALVRKLDLLAKVNPKVHAGILRLIDRLVSDPAMSESAVQAELDRLLGLEPGEPN